jgi:hypothetical protein
MRELTTKKTVMAKRLFGEVRVGLQSRLGHKLALTKGLCKGLLQPTSLG